jgi:hypothetical protein
VITVQRESLVGLYNKLHTSICSTIDNEEKKGKGKEGQNEVEVKMRRVTLGVWDWVGERPKEDRDRTSG